MEFVLLSQLLGRPLFGSFHSSRFYCLTYGKKKKEKEGKEGRRYLKKEEKKGSLLLAFNKPNQFCWSSWLQQAEGGLVGWI